MSRRDALRAGVVSTAVIGGVTGAGTMMHAAPAVAAAAATGEGWISVLDHGAAGDGTTDDTAAIQAALNAARSANPNKSVYFPAGRIFKVSDQVNATGLSDSVISGHGATLSLAGSAASVLGGKAVLQLRDCLRVKVLGLTVRDADRLHQYDGVRVSSSRAIVVDGVHVYNTRFNGIVVYDSPAPRSDDITITNCTTEGTRTGITTNGKDVRIVNNHVAMDWPSTDEGQSGLPWNGTTSNYFDGICVWAGGDRTVISGNTITECGQAGVYCQDVTNLVVADNTVYGCIGRGIEVDGARGVKLRDDQPDSVVTTRAFGVTITGNVLRNNDGNINLIFVSDATVVGNRIENSDANHKVTCIAVNRGTNRTVVAANHARQAHPTSPAVWVHDNATEVSLAWNEVHGAVHHAAPAGTVVMRRSAEGLITASGSLKTTGKVIAIGGLGVGNSVVASTPGSVVRKMEVFSSTGASLGWVPIYNSIG
ncbi:right-handed parallel beta-helix repeat-containing protein [Micromonospora sp. CPCC 206061]|uniref:right-handed parallel beta-helix repeat-containing protein n=1 Tax=Micromonospora sp. CPCC 206061 TaxID=3122410 RepID=UPI002FF39D90